MLLHAILFSVLAFVKGDSIKYRRPDPACECYKYQRKAEKEYRRQLKQQARHGAMLVKTAAVQNSEQPAKVNIQRRRYLFTKGSGPKKSSKRSSRRLKRSNSRAVDCYKW